MNLRPKLPRVVWVSPNFDQCRTCRLLKVGVNPRQRSHPPLITHTTFSIWTHRPHSSSLNTSSKVFRVERVQKCRGFAGIFRRCMWRNDEMVGNWGSKKCFEKNLSNVNTSRDFHRFRISSSHSASSLRGKEGSLGQICCKVDEILVQLNMSWKQLKSHTKWSRREKWPIPRESTGQITPGCVGKSAFFWKSLARFLEGCEVLTSQQHTAPPRMYGLLRWNPCAV